MTQFKSVRAQHGPDRTAATREVDAFPQQRWPLRPRWWRQYAAPRAAPCGTEGGQVDDRGFAFHHLGQQQTGNGSQREALMTMPEGEPEPFVFRRPANYWLHVGCTRPGPAPAANRLRPHFPISAHEGPTVTRAKAILPAGYRVASSDAVPFVPERWRNELIDHTVVRMGMSGPKRSKA